MENLVFDIRRKLKICKLGKRLAQSCVLAYGRFKCLAGLPKPMLMAAKTTAVLCSDVVEFYGNGMQFDLKRAQITDVGIKAQHQMPGEFLKSWAIYNTVVSNTKGMIHGEYLKNRKGKRIDKCLVFTFKQGQSVDYIIFDINTDSSLLAAQKFQSEFQKSIA